VNAALSSDLPWAEWSVAWNALQRPLKLGVGPVVSASVSLGVSPGVSPGVSLEVSPRVSLGVSLGFGVFATDSVA
jgi:hypothetical protein